jgi:hypothetical protein
LNFYTISHRLFTTFPQETCPKSYLQLLPLHNESDGFTILKNFTFLHSPQIDGKYRDFHAAVNNLIIYDDENLHTLFGHDTWLGNKITLANLQDGTLAVLQEHILALLCETKCQLIIGETSLFWREIWEHRRNPTNLTAPV